MNSIDVSRNETDKVKYITQPYLLGPAASYEIVGDVPNVVFPCAALHVIEEEKLAVYYGAVKYCCGLGFQ